MTSIDDKYIKLLLNHHEALNTANNLMVTYEKIIKNYNKMLLWTFKCLKEAQKSKIRFDNPYFVDEEIKRLENELYCKN